MQRAIFFLSSLVFTASSAFAQTMPKPDGVWRGSLGLGAAGASGNTESTTYSVNGDAVRQTENSKTNGYIQSVYGRSESAGASQRTSDLIRAGGKHDRNINENKFAFGSIDLERDQIIDLDLRSVVAGGLGYHVVKREGFTFDVSTGPAYNRERYSTGTREFIEWLIAEESTHAFTPTVSFRQRLAYYPNLKESGEFRILFDIGLVLKVTSNWSATITLNDRYQSNPLPGVKKNDLLFVTGLQYAFNP